jgi:hypothetical protein
MNGKDLMRILKWVGIAAIVAIPIVILLSQRKKEKKEEKPVLFYKDIDNIFEEEMK